MDFLLGWNCILKKEPVGSFIHPFVDLWVNFFSNGNKIFLQPVEQTSIKNIFFADSRRAHASLD